MAFDSQFGLWRFDGMNWARFSMMRRLQPERLICAMAVFLLSGGAGHAVHYGRRYPSRIELPVLSPDNPKFTR
jgi:hypothetical protein